MDIGIDIGIDLGTTYSVIAVKGKVSLGPGYPDGEYLEHCDVTIIPTPQGDLIFPSVFWANPDDPSQVLIGSDAKEKAKEGEAPIMFSKRAIGTTVALPMGPRTYTAKAVATEVLRHLKDCAERALGKPVRRAVVTHPAYFDPNQVQQTREAANAAGFDMALPEQMMMEPTAAALAYTLNDPRDPLRVMTYDLGGGTFDVAVLERREGVITMKGFDGDHLLGGYNFDRALVEWILGRLRASGRSIPYDDADPVHRARRARLLQLAENTKFKLAEAPTDRTPVTIKNGDILVDADGRPVQIVLTITAQQYAALIQEELDSTIACCHQALGKAGVAAAELDQVLLVGGSTYAPWVEKAVTAAFASPVEPYHPDLCVAAGAAILAAGLPAESLGGGLKLTLEFPTDCALTHCNVRGTVGRADGSPLGPDPGLRVELRRAGATLNPKVLDAGGVFLFEDLELAEGQVNAMELRLIDAEGSVCLSRTIAVRQSEEGAAAAEIHTVLPKPIYLKTRSGLKLIAQEGVPLPAKCTVSGVRAFGDSLLVVDIYQSDRKIGEVRVADIPEDAGEGALVNIEVEITDKNQMRGTAQVFGKSGVVVQSSEVRIDFPPIYVPSESELRAEYDRLKHQREQLESKDPDQRLVLATEGTKLESKIDNQLSHQAADRQELQRDIEALRKLIEPPQDDLDPPRAEFRRVLNDCYNYLAGARSNRELQALRPVLTEIETKANDALATRNQRQWMQANDGLQNTHDRIRQLLDSTGGDGLHELPPTPFIKSHFRVKGDQVRRLIKTRHEELGRHADYATRFKPRLERIEGLLDGVLKAIEAIPDNMKPEQALGKAQLAALPLPKLEEDVKLVDFSDVDAR